MMTTYRPSSWTRCLSACVVLLLLSALCVTSYGQSKPPAAPPAEEATQAEETAKAKPSTRPTSQPVNSGQPKPLAAPRSSQYVAQPASAPAKRTEGEIRVILKEAREQFQAKWPNGLPDDLEGELAKLQSELAAMKDEHPDARQQRQYIRQLELWISQTSMRNGWWNSLSAPAQAFALRHFDANGDGKLDALEWWAFRDFQDDASRRWWLIMLNRDDMEVGSDMTTASGIKVEPIFDKVFAKIAGLDNDETIENLPQDKMNALGKRLSDGQLRYIMQFEQQALADNGDKADETTRAAMLKAIDADMRQRFKKADTKNTGHLDADGIEKFLTELFNELGLFKDGEAEIQPAASAAETPDTNTEEVIEWQPSAEDLKRWDKDGDGKLNEEEMAAMLRDVVWDGTPVPMQEFALRNFDADSDGQLDDAEWKAYRAFYEELRNSEMDWAIQMLGLDKGANIEQIEKVMKPIVDNVEQALEKRAKPDEGEPVLWYRSENMRGGWFGDLALGYALYFLQFEQQALADHGGKPNDTTRAAMRKAYEADMHRRIEQAIGNKGHLTPQEAETFLIELLDERVKAGYEYGQAQKKK